MGSGLIGKPTMALPVKQYNDDPLLFVTEEKQDLSVGNSGVRSLLSKRKVFLEWYTLYVLLQRCEAETCMYKLHKGAYWRDLG